MSGMYLALVDDDLGTLELSQANGILVEEFDPGFPEVRSSVINRPDGNGTIDDSQYFGQRVVTMSGYWHPLGTGKTRNEIRQSILAYLVPWKRPKLLWQQDVGDIVYEAQLRVDRSSFKVMSVADEFTLSLKVEPLWANTEASSIAAPYSASVALGGDDFPWIGPGASTPGYIDFVDGQSSSGTLANLGIAPAPPTIVLWGHAPNAALTNLATGAVFAFTGLNILEGQQVTIDMQARTAVLDNTYSVFNYIDFSISTWWNVLPGDQYITLTTSPGPSAAMPYATVSWKDLYL